MKMNFLPTKEVKEIYYDDDARSKLISGITKLAKAVKSTLGARGRTVLIESKQHVGGITVTKDGVTVASSINVSDATEDLAINLMKEAAGNTANEAGDGTTTSIVLAEALVTTATSLLKDTDSIDVVGVTREMQAMCDETISYLRKLSRKMTNKTIESVATISANNDKELGGLIADTYKEVGKNGVVTVDNSEGPHTYAEVVSGIQIDRGWTSPLFVTDTKTQEGVMDNNPYVLITDHEIPSVDSIEGLLRPIIAGKKELLIIGNLDSRFQATLNSNIAKQGANIKIKHIIPPQFGWKQHDLMRDLAVALGGKYVCSQHGDDLSLVTLDHLGSADRIVVGQNKTLIFPKAEREGDITEHLKALWDEHDGLKLKDMNAQKDEQAFIKERIATLAGNIGIIKVGAQTEMELKEKRDRVDDAVCATRAAMEEGILPGGGVALCNAADKLFSKYCKTDLIDKDPKSVAAGIMFRSLLEPYVQILRNAGMEDTSLEQPKGNWGWDVKEMKYVDMYKAGIIDPTKVTVCALKNAVSVATTILTTNAIITNK